jgi:molybdopterin synthase sulfur carrier subunit
MPVFNGTTGALHQVVGLVLALRGGIINRMITVLYFARLREALGTGSEQLALPPEVRDVAGLRMLLAARGGAWRQEFAANGAVRAAVNQSMADGETRVADGDEVAFFPPVTGG